MGNTSSGSEWIEGPENVQKLIDEVNKMIKDPNHMFELQRERKNEDPLDPFTTNNTLRSLEYDEDDIEAELSNLSLRDYAKTVLDVKRKDDPPFWIFSKNIKSSEVYIKFKIRSERNKHIFCMSFHFARELVLNKPYKDYQEV